MKKLTLICFAAMFIVGFSYAQTGLFPESWIGNWKGELLWYKTSAKVPQKVTMELRIHPADSTDKYSWQIIYGSESADNRPYQLLPREKEKGHWVIDENNGILLDQYWLANKFCGTFTVGNSTIMNSYWMEGDRLVAEFYNISAKPIATTGKGTEESPSVDSYKVATYQRATLTRQ